MATGLFLVALFFASAGQAWLSFKTEPHIFASEIHVLKTQRTDAEPLDPGYIFVAPIITRKQNVHYGGLGPQIFDNDGELVWYGNDSASHRAMRFHTCNHPTEAGKTALCWHGNTHDYGGHARGIVRFLDETYTRIEPDFDRQRDSDLPDGPDEHELNTPFDEQNLIEAVYQTRSVDLSAFGAPKNGYIVDSCFQEVDMRTRKLRFEWCAHDHGLQLWDSRIVHNRTKGPNHLLGTGNKTNPFDPWHINGVDKNKEGDYLVSLRHSNGIFKIAGISNPNGKPPGSIIWSLRGVRHKGDFKQDFHFRGQHACRFVNTSASIEFITFFNNYYHEGILVEIDNSTMTARQAMVYRSPGDIVPLTGGGMQLLPKSKHAFVGWGNTAHPAYWSEFEENGSFLMHAKFGDNFEYSAQAWKHAWVGKPLTKPKLLPFALKCTTGMLGYASWNGATEVRQWEFFTSNQRDGPWKSVGKFRKTGFETKALLADSYSAYAYVDGLDANGQRLGTSKVMQTFTPQEKYRKLCNWEGCRKMFDYDHGKSTHLDCDALTAQTLHHPGHRPGHRPGRPHRHRPWHTPHTPHTPRKVDLIMTVTKFVFFCTFVESAQWVLYLVFYTFYEGHYTPVGA